MGDCEGTLLLLTLSYSLDKDIWKRLLEVNIKAQAWMKKDLTHIFKFGKGRADVPYPWTVEVADSVHGSRVLSVSWLRTISSVDTWILTGGFT